MTETVASAHADGFAPPAPTVGAQNHPCSAGELYGLALASQLPIPKDFADKTALRAYRQATGRYSRTLRIAQWSSAHLGQVLENLRD